MSSYLLLVDGLAHVLFEGERVQQPGHQQKPTEQLKHISTIGATPSSYNALLPEYVISFQNTRGSVLSSNCAIFKRCT
jgi:hypothetical protein